jgi:TM2 domain-containing membrane protein YozV
MACTACGFAVGSGANYCANCGVQVAPGQAVCVACGAPLMAAAPAPVSEAKSRSTAVLLALFLNLGIYNFYLGYTTKAIIQLILTLTVCLAPVSAIWGLIEGIQLLYGKINVDGKGNPLKEITPNQQ